MLESEDHLAGLPPAERAAYGATPEAQLFGVSLELCLTWVNRLLFLKLLERRLRRYHAGNPAALIREQGCTRQRKVLYGVR